MVSIGYFFHLHLALENNKDFVLKKKIISKQIRYKKRSILLAFLMGSQGQK
jgi:hypothetical protein